MEAGNPKRAAVRLAIAGGGVLLTVGLLVATARVASRPSAEPAVAEQAEWDLIETGESYQLPQAPEPVTPVAKLIAPTPAYEPPVYDKAPTEDLAVVEPPFKFEDAAGESSDASPAWNGPVTIHNPAAYGPPEDGSLPPIPMIAAGEGPRMAATPSAEPLTTTPLTAAPPTAWQAPQYPTPPTEPLESGSPDDGLVSEDRAADVLNLAAKADPIQHQAATPVRPLRDLGPTDGDALLSYTASTNDLSKRLADEVQAGFQLGKSGAIYAARGKFVGVLRRIALAKDAEDGSSRHAAALAEGLRTLDDADDFVPRGDALEAELDVAAIASSHGLRLVGGGDSPHEAVARYSQHAAAKLAEAAASEPAGSMALYGLGKTYARLEAQGDDPTAGRKSLVMYRAAIDSNHSNYLAANELGVRLARAGRYQQASEVLRQAAARPDAIATVHANLAAIEQKLGNQATATLARQHSERLAQQERATGQVSRRHGVDWVAPDQLRQGGSQPTPAPQPAPVMAAQPQPVGPGFAVSQPQPAASGGWSGFVQRAKQATGWSTTPQTVAAPQPGYTGPPVMASQPRVIR